MNSCIAYHVQRVQELAVTYIPRVTFCKWLVQISDADRNPPRSILFIHRRGSIYQRVNLDLYMQIQLILTLEMIKIYLPLNKNMLTYLFRILKRITRNFRTCYEFKEIFPSFERNSFFSRHDVQQRLLS